MEYTILKLGKLAGISTRTLRYYDEIGLLKPERINSSDYRIYGEEQVDRLQQILFYKELGVGLSEIKEILDAPEFDRTEALRMHARRLEEKQQRLEQLIKNVYKTIQKEEGETEMTDKEKFEGFKKTLVDENEKSYGAEVRKAYGDKAADESNAKMMNLSREEYDTMQKLAEEIQTELELAVKNGEDPAGNRGQKVAAMHKEWLGFTWKEYSPDAHAGLAEMYVADDRFTAYYDKQVNGCAQFLRDAIVELVKK